MSGERAIHIGGNAAGNVLTTGDGNKISANVTGEVSVGQRPAPDIDVKAQLSLIRQVLKQVETEHQSKIMRALDDATEEAEKQTPSKSEVGKAIDRALEYAKTSANFITEVGSLGAPLKQVVEWLGVGWQQLLAHLG